MTTNVIEHLEFTGGCDFSLPYYNRCIEPWILLGKEQSENGIFNYFDLTLMLFHKCVYIFFILIKKLII